MTPKLQQVVDSLANTLQRDVAVDDPAMRLIAHSAHFGPMDQVRQESIMRRKVPQNAAQWLRSQGIADSRQPLRLPGNDSCAMLPRICAPIRCRDVLLGFLYIIDEPPLTPDEVERAADAAAVAGEALLAERFQATSERSREHKLVRDLLSGDPCLADTAATELVEHDLAPVSCLVVALVFCLAQSVTVPTHRDLLAHALEEARRLAPSRRILHLLRREHGVVILLGQNHGALRADAKRFSNIIMTQFPQSVLAAVEETAVIGIGEVHPCLTASAESYWEASWAAEIASAVPGLGKLVSWSDLGVYQYFAKLPQNVLRDDLVHEGLALLVADQQDALVTTLETYLDLAGDAKKTSAMLNLHRTSLYYRLRRIEQLTGTDLRDGHDRLQLHLALKAARIHGVRHRPPALIQQVSQNGQEDPVVGPRRS